MTSPRPLFAAPDVRTAVILIVGEQILDLAFPVRIDARLTQDLGLSAGDRQRIERARGSNFSIAALGAGASWSTVADVANFVALRKRRQEGIARIEASTSRARLTDPQRQFRAIAPYAPLPWRVGAEQHGGNVAVYDALGMELLIVGEWSGMTDQEAAAIAAAIVTAANAQDGVTPEEHAEIHQLEELAYRDHYCTHRDDPPLVSLGAKGLMSCRDSALLSRGNVYFLLTEAGREAALSLVPEYAQ